MKDIFNLIEQREKELKKKIEVYRIQVEHDIYNQIELFEEIKDCKIRIDELYNIRRRVKDYSKL